MERLDKLLAATGRWSRKEAKALVKAGRVRVAGVLPQGPEDKVTPGTPVTVDGRLVETETFTYLMLHKPAGVVSATEDSRDKTVLDLLPPDLRRRGLFPVGRLDKDTEGLLLLTNDGGLAHRLLSPGPPCEQGVLCGGRWTAEPGGSGGVPARPCFTGWNGMPACGTHRAGPAQPRADHLGGGKIPPGQTDAGSPGEASDLPQTPLHGAYYLGS